eukprot:CAMPEP_0181213222 /NCGR_PEP_ID=MMETSP1096-20121128/24785_1 /TAXON_ID=156174 ORGANISM="Chrysochromulina ericina, Strain CCMP281" /NCGR_SAMPLE_ID=MMETSP1096 /ASSEMBLY_ACC=CAM_ASM_000453 /LENGTH=73 /DNA_ID=CAMNT_0023304837 /DNA_START=255 /DNA_END=476 /DNA_ORIENTATION=+
MEAVEATGGEAEEEVTETTDDGEICKICARRAAPVTPHSRGADTRALSGRRSLDVTWTTVRADSKVKRKRRES